MSYTEHREWLPQVSETSSDTIQAEDGQDQLAARQILVKNLQATLQRINVLEPGEELDLSQISFSQIPPATDDSRTVSVSQVLDIPQGLKVALYNVGGLVDKLRGSSAYFGPNAINITDEGDPLLILPPISQRRTYDYKHQYGWLNRDHLNYSTFLVNDPKAPEILEDKIYVTPHVWGKQEGILVITKNKQEELIVTGFTVEEGAFQAGMGDIIIPEEAVAQVGESKAEEAHTIIASAESEVAEAMAEPATPQIEPIHDLSLLPNQARELLGFVTSELERAGVIERGEECNPLRLIHPEVLPIDDQARNLFLILGLNPFPLFLYLREEMAVKSKPVPIRYEENNVLLGLHKTLPEFDGPIVLSSPGWSSWGYVYFDGSYCWAGGRSHGSIETRLIVGPHPSLTEEEGLINGLLAIVNKKRVDFASVLTPVGFDELFDTNGTLANLQTTPPAQKAEVAAELATQEKEVVVEQPEIEKVPELSETEYVKEIISKVLSLPKKGDRAAAYHNLYSYSRRHIEVQEDQDDRLGFLLGEHKATIEVNSSGERVNSLVVKIGNLNSRAALDLPGDAPFSDFLACFSEDGKDKLIVKLWPNFIGRGPVKAWIEIKKEEKSGPGLVRSSYMPSRSVTETSTTSVRKDFPSLSEPGSLSELVFNIREQQEAKPVKEEVSGSRRPAYEQKSVTNHSEGRAELPDNIDPYSSKFKKDQKRTKSRRKHQRRRREPKSKDEGRRGQRRW